ncbi:hypothetical protein OUZ56_032757 [Daphnia magna]|uniref:Uncharacterized protein n=1 Tax=Daphnia magna TaxID=35525 RepID=A0ABQ9ZX22_9CRUS|nr:hypothetical protein OUZ56_032757 [Daphnia magna]
MPTTDHRTAFIYAQHSRDIHLRDTHVLYSTIRRLDLPGQFQKGYPPTMDPPTTTFPCYPWEWIGILILCMLGTGVAIAADRTKTASRQQKIEAQMQALEHRLQLHEQATSPDETE